jgi:hypothetical protein
MISYEELCQALDRFNARRRNAAELANLEQEPEEPREQPQHVSPADDTAPVSMAEDPFQETAEQDPAEAAGFAEQPKEDTHEIDVDDVMLDDRLAEDKIPGD